MDDTKRIEQLKEFWTIRNPQHEDNTNSGKDMFWGTVLCIFDDMNEALNLPDVTNSALMLKVQKLEADNKLLRFMVDNGINEEEMFNSNDITMPQER